MKTIAEQITALEAKRQASAARMEAVMQKSSRRGSHQRRGRAGGVRHARRRGRGDRQGPGPAAQARKRQGVGGQGGRQGRDRARRQHGARRPQPDLCGAEAKHCAAGFCLARADLQDEGAFHQAIAARGAQAGIRRRRADPRGAEFHHQGGGRFRPIPRHRVGPASLSIPRFRISSPRCSQIRFIRHWRREAESSHSVVRALSACRRGRARRRLPDRSSRRVRRSPCGKVRSRPSPLRRRRWR